MNDVGYRLLFADRAELAIAAFKLNLADHPASANVYDSLGEAYAKHGDWKLATESYSKSLALDPTNDNAKHELEVIKTQSKGGKKRK